MQINELDLAGFAEYLLKSRVTQERHAPYCVSLTPGRESRSRGDLKPEEEGGGGGGRVIGSWLWVIGPQGKAVRPRKSVH